MKRKIINDPVFGFINIPNQFILDIINHSYFQRLANIKQLGLTSFVYPGATHTRMLHSLGAMHLMGEAITQLVQKGQHITDEEKNAVRACMLLHDIGHGPFSHTLEHSLVSGISHENISFKMMQKMNREMNGQLDLAIDIFTNKYEKKYLHQLVSGQLDMDRLDYLSRDSFFCGVSEGVIGASRIIKMLNLKDDRLVVEEKGIYSIEKFLVARRLMYWQVYLHKTGVSADKMLMNILKRAKELSVNGEKLFGTEALQYFLKNDITIKDFEQSDEVLDRFAELDDNDILSAIKVWSKHSDRVLSLLSHSFINRKLFKVTLLENEEETAILKEKRLNKIIKKLQLSEKEAHYFVDEEVVSTDTYNRDDETIDILMKNGKIKDISEASDMLNIDVLTKRVKKNYLFYYRV